MRSINHEKATELRHRLHEHPELACQEEWTRKTLIEYLKANTDLEIQERGVYFYAVYRTQAAEKRPAIAFRADIDALPIEDRIDKPYKSKIDGLGHKCGHDGHAANLCAFATELADLQPDRDVYLVFQPGEETGQGAILAKDVLIENPDIAEVYGFHNETECELGKVMVNRGTSNCASKGMNICMQGSSTHASLPEKGKNPVFALAEIVRQVPAISDPKRYRGLILCTIVHMEVGEPGFGTAADKGVLRMTIRGEFEEEMLQMQDELAALARQEAEKAGVTCEITYEDEFPETRNDIEKADKVLAAAEALGFAHGVIPEAARGSEDFGHFLKVRPGALFFIGNGADCPSFHTVEYDFNDDVIPYATEMFKKLVEM